MTSLADAAQQMAIRHAQQAVFGTQTPGNTNVMWERWNSDRQSIAGWGTHGDRQWFWLFTQSPNGVIGYKMFDTAVAAKAEYDSAVQRWTNSGHEEVGRVELDPDEQLACPTCGHRIGDQDSQGA